MRCKVFTVPVESEPALDHERVMNDFLSTTNVKRVFASLANQPKGATWSILFFYEGDGRVTQKAPANYTATVADDRRLPEGGTDASLPLTSEQVKAILALKKWRTDQAAQEGVPLYMVAQNRWLEDMVRLPVRAVDDLTKIRGLGEWRIQKYGAKIIEIMNASNAGRRSWPNATPYASGPAGRA